jgi:hypothetical protein
MKLLLRILALMAVGALAAGCANVTLVDPAKPQAMGDITVMPQIAWNQFSGDHKIWTVNGPGLDSLHFLTGVKSGQPLFAPFGVPKNEMAVYDAKMLPNDIQDLLVGSLQKEGYQNVRPGDLAPCPFGTATGFCFDLAFATADGLEMKGLVLADKRDSGLDMIAFLAPSEYYFGALSPDVSKLFASVTLK